MAVATSLSLLPLGVLIFVVVSSPPSCNGQDVVVQIKPNTFLPSVTPMVTLTCSMTSHSGTAPRILFMQFKKKAFLDSLAADDAPPALNSTRGGEEGADQDGGPGKAGRRRRTGPEKLIATFTPGAARPSLHVDDEEHRLKLEGSIAESRVTLVIHRPQSSDVGLYVCHSSYLNAFFRLVEFNAAANLTIIVDEGSSSLLLAKEQILETQQKHLEDEEVVLKEELKQALKTNAELSDRVQRLEARTEDTTLLLQNLMNNMKSPSGVPMKMTAPSSRMRTSEAGSSRDVEEELKEARSALRHLENDVVANLASRIKAMEGATVITGVGKRLKSLEDRAAATALEHELKVKSQQSSDVIKRPGERGNDEERFQSVVDRLDELELKTLKEISSRVVHLEQGGEMVDVKARLDRVEGMTVTTLVERITALDREQAKEDDKIERVKVKMDQIQNRIDTLSEGGEANQGLNAQNILQPPKEGDSKAPAEAAQKLSGRKCYVCGDASSSQPCSMGDLRSAASQSCPQGADYCVNDLFQEAHARSIYKRCVDKEECLRLHNSPISEDCANFNFMSHGNFDCHFCCTTDLCNMDFRPSISLFRD